MGERGNDHIIILPIARFVAIQKFVFDLGISWEQSLPDRLTVFERLEPGTRKLVRPVLRGVGGSDVTHLLDVRYASRVVDSLVAWCGIPKLGAVACHGIFCFELRPGFWIDASVLFRPVIGRAWSTVTLSGVSFPR